MKYGQIIDNTCQIHKLFVDYFENPVLTKYKDNEENSVYITPIRSLIGGNNYRYLLVITDKDDVPLGNIKNMKDLNWNIISTKSDSKDYNIDRLHSYKIKTNKDLNKILNLKNVTETYKTFENQDLNLTASLIFTDKDNYGFLEKTYLINALETYNCVVNLGLN